MHKAIWLAGTAVSLLATPVLAQSGAIAQEAAQAPVPTGPATQAPAVDAAQQGVLVFEPVFFASANPSTAFDMIRRLPGFSLDTGDSDTRGFAGAAGNVLIDGDRPSSKSDGLDSILRRISAASVERVELIRGGAPGIDMQGRAVVANVVLRKTVTTERVIELNSYIYPDGYFGPVIGAQYARRAGDRTFEAAFSATTDRTNGTGEGFRRRYDPGTGALIQDAELIRWDRFRNARGSVALQQPFGGGKLRLNGLLGWGDHAWEQDTVIRAGSGSDAFNEELSEEIDGELGVNWTRDLSPRVGLELIGLQRWGTEDYVGTTANAGGDTTFTSDDTAGESIARAVLRYRPNDRWAFETGGEVAYNFLDTATTYAENGVPVPLPSAEVKVEELRGEIFGQTTWRPSPTFTLEAALRVEVSEISQSGDSDQSKSFVYPKPRLQATWTPRPGNQFRLRLEREVGQLDFEDFAASADIDVGQVEGGNPDLEPSKAWVIEGVYERRFWGDGVVDFTYRHSRFEDVVDNIPLAGGFDGVGNIGDGTHDRVEVALTLPTDRLGVPHGRFQARANWTWSSVTDPLTGEDREFAGTLPFGCGLGFTQDLRGGRWSYGVDHGCNNDRATYFRTREVRENMARAFVTVWGQFKPKEDLTIRVDIGNAGDQLVGYDRDVHAGPRDTTPVAYREVRRTRMSPWLFLQIRKSL